MATPTSNIPKRLYTGAPAAGVDTLLYTSPAGMGTRITGILLCNTSAAATTINIWLTTAGAGADGTAIAKAITIPGDGWPVLLDVRGVIMNAADTIRAQAVAAVVTIHLFGIEMAA